MGQERGEGVTILTGRAGFSGVEEDWSRESCRG